MENKEEGKSCCEKSKCCGCKALIAIALLAIGGLGGYFCGRGCALKRCSVKEAPAMSAPAQK